MITVLLTGRFVGNKKSSITTSQNINIESGDIDTEKNFLPLPDSFQIKNVPFTSQAPFANWDQLHDEACEEASLIIVKYYLNQNALTPETAENEIQNMVSWEIGYFGSHKDLTVAETIIVAQKYYGLDNLLENKITSIDDIKTEISQNHLVIVPTAGRLLGNPNFRSPGPVYHMLVISGYDKNGFTTQDVGTKNGRNYYYNQTILFNAIHDWTGTPDSIDSGAKSIIIVN